MATPTSGISKSSKAEFWQNLAEQAGHAPAAYDISDSEARRGVGKDLGDVAKLLHALTNRSDSKSVTKVASDVVDVAVTKVNLVNSVPIYSLKQAASAEKEAPAEKSSLSLY